MSIRQVQRCGVVVAVLAIGAWAVADDVVKKPSKNAPAKNTAKADHGDKTEKPDPLAVPDGSPAELVAYLQGLRRVRATKMDAKSYVEFMQKRDRAMIQAAQKILDGKPDEAQAIVAARAKVNGLIGWQRNPDDATVAQIGQLQADLEKAGWKGAVRAVKGQILELCLTKAIARPKPELDSLVDDIRNFLGSDPQRDDFMLITYLGFGLERAGGGDKAATTIRDLAKVFAASKNPDVAAMAARFEGLARRLGSVGKPIELEGKFVDGEPLDWKEYQGKVVLVDFWATWCGPCRAEFPNVLKAYEAYHDRGFTVLGVSLDSDRAALEKYLEQNKLPWKILFDDKAATGFATPLAVRYGVNGIPCMLLVGKDGKVAALQARGPALHEQLAKLLGPAKTTP